jgi:hypothetical protein
VLDLLADWHQKPALGHLIVIAGLALLQARAVATAEFSAWLDGAPTRGLWVDAAWVMPLRSVLDDQARTVASN